MFDVFIGRPYIVFWVAIIFLSSSLIVGREYGTAKKL